mgnify:CR=1 FL=1
MNEATIRRLALGVLLSLPLAACDDDTGDDGASTTDAATTDADTGTPATTTTGAPSTSGTSEKPTSTTGESGPVDDSSDDAATDDDSGSDDGSTGGEGLEIVGEWVETFPDMTTQTHSVDETTWTSMSQFGTLTFHVESYDNALGVLVAQNDASNDFNPDLFSRFEWVWDGRELYYCQSVYDAATADEAWSAAGADAGDLLAGCSTFPWSMLQTP